MKNKFLSFLLVVSILSSIIIAFPTSASAAYYTMTNWKLAYTISGGEVTITGYTTTSSPHTLEIPAKISGYPVTKIGDSAFANCDSLLFLTFPNSIKHIGQSAFEGCDNLYEITGTPNLEYIGDYAFYECKYLTA